MMVQGQSGGFSLPLPTSPPTPAGLWDMAKNNGMLPYLAGPGLGAAYNGGQMAAEQLPVALDWLRQLLTTPGGGVTGGLFGGGGGGGSVPSLPDAGPGVPGGGGGLTGSMMPGPGGFNWDNVAATEPSLPSGDFGVPGGNMPGPGAFNWDNVAAAAGSNPQPEPQPNPRDRKVHPAPHRPRVAAALDVLKDDETELPPGAEQLGNATVYEIQPGDSLSLIGSMFGLTYDELIEQNPELLGADGKATVIHPGQRITVNPVASRGTNERSGVRDKGFTSTDEAADYSKARRKGFPGATASRFAKQRGV